MAARGVILVVEDEVAIVEMLRDYLGEQGFEVDVAMNGGDAVMLATLRRPDAVILDVKLPDSSGGEVLRQLREVDESIAVVMLSGGDDAEAARPLLKAGAFDYIRKPFKFDHLDATIRLAVAVGMKKPPRGVVLPFKSDRRAESPAEESPALACGVCGETIDEVKNAITDADVLVHAACWRRGARKV
jgi:DNA-binding response OmpR family regulator